MTLFLNNKAKNKQMHLGMAKNNNYQNHYPPVLLVQNLIKTAHTVY